MSRVLYLLLKAAVYAGLGLLGCGVRLFYWSVRTYGWGRVGSFLAALAGSIWLHARLGWLSFSSVSLVSVLAGTLGLWGAFLAGALWLTQRWQRWRHKTFTESPNLSLPNYPTTRPILTLRRSLVPVAEGTELWERLVDLNTLEQAWQRVLRRGGGPGPDGVTVETFALQAEQNLQQLATQLRSGRYHPQPPRWVEVPKPSGGTRRLGVLSVQDRIVQQALLSVLVPQWDERFAPCSYAYRPGRSAQQAVEAVEQALAAGRVWVVDADIESFFDSVPHAPLFALLVEWLPDVAVRRLVELCVSTTAPAAGRGLTQGAPLSPLLANLYLHRFDCVLMQTGHCLVRYADDFIILCATRLQAEESLETARRLLAGLQLRLNPEKTRIVHRDEGFTFLGWTFTKEGKHPNAQAIKSLQVRLAAAADETTRRQILAGWQGYFGQENGRAALANANTRIPGVELYEELADFLPNLADSESMPKNEDGNVLDGALARYRELFVGRPDVFARFWQNGERKGYLPVRRSLTDQELQEHLAGRIVLGTYPLLPEGRTRALILDIDGPDYSESGRRAAFQVAQELAEALRRQNIAPLWVDSGGKGFHLWICFSKPVSSQAVRQWANRWLERFRPFPAGVVVEVFPKQDRLAPSALGALIRLPFGRHPETGRRSTLLSESGEPIQDVWAALTATSFLEPEMVLATEPTPEESEALPQPPEAIAPVVQGCTLLWELVNKAGRTRHLRHTERLALLYTLGHLGEEGRNYLHQVIALCSNYDPRVTERWIQRLEAGHRPIRCATLREWLKDYLAGVACSCGLTAGNPSPLDLRRQAKKPWPEQVPTRQESGDEVWDEVAEEMFGDALAS